jgi:hypothetical protein
MNLNEGGDTPDQQKPPPAAYEMQAIYENSLRRAHKQYGAAGSTVEALMYELRTLGLAALAGPNCRRRVSELSPDQVRAVIERLDRLRPNYPAITDDLILTIGELL